MNLLLKIPLISLDIFLSLSLPTFHETDSIEKEKKRKEKLN